MFRDVVLEVEGREGVYNCLELPGSEEPLLGDIPLEDLGLELDLQVPKLKVLPMEGKDTYLTILEVGIGLELRDQVQSHMYGMRAQQAILVQ